MLQFIAPCKAKENALIEAIRGRDWDDFPNENRFINSDDVRTTTEV